ncbi:hypothetical protein KCU73_g51, partial [Aureobasidium melanogenum]
MRRAVVAAIRRWCEVMWLLVRDGGYSAAGFETRQFLAMVTKVIRLHQVHYQGKRQLMGLRLRHTDRHTEPKEKSCERRASCHQRAMDVPWPVLSSKSDSDSTARHSASVVLIYSWTG